MGTLLQEENMKKIILDINIDGDCTNLCSLAVLNILKNEGEAEILATTACYKSPLATGCIKAINRYYGNPDIPVGILHCQDETHPTSFPSYINQIFCPDHPFGEDAEDTVSVLRRVLSAQEDDSVVFVVAGCFASAAALLQSEPDSISPLSGHDLCHRKISRIVAMAGAFDTFKKEEVFPENNVVVQIPAAKYVTENWKKEFVFSGFEIGQRIQTLKEFRHFGPFENPLQLAYNLLDASRNLPLGDNQSWDQTAVLEGVRPGQYFNYHEYGRIHVTDDGITEWVPESGGRMTFLVPKVNLLDVRAVINDMIFPEWRQYEHFYRPFMENPQGFALKSLVSRFPGEEEL